MAGLQLSGLASGFDWKSLVEQLMQVERAPIARMETEQKTNTQRSNALSSLGDLLDKMQNSAGALKQANLFSTRTAKSDATTGAWSASAAASTTPGSYKFNVTRLATTTKLLGASQIAPALSDSEDVSSLTIGTLRTAVSVTGGTFSINGKSVTVSLGDSLQDVFDAISTATEGDIEASYDPENDAVVLTNTQNQPIVLGAANDTSNFLRAMRLSNAGSATSLSSGGRLGTISQSAKLENLGLTGISGAADENGQGSFKINGVSIAYDLKTDSLSAVVRRINQSSAGVTAAYDVLNDRVTLTNNRTGDLGLNLSESSPGLLSALGLTQGGTIQQGRDALFTLNDGPALTSASNSFDSSAHGITGLSFTATSTGQQTITVAADATSMRGKIDAFITAYNNVQSFIDEKTRTSSSNGKVTTAVLSTNREVQDWSRQLRALAVNSLSQDGTIKRLDQLGIGFTGVGSTLSVLDDTKLDAALRDQPTAVENFFQTSTTGFAAKLDAMAERFSKASDGVQKRLTAANADLDRQIEDMDRRLTQQREILTNSFIKMEEAQQKIQQQSSAISNAFVKSSS